MTERSHIHPTAVIGDPPEHRDRKEDWGGFYPVIDKSARINAFVTVDSGMSRATRIGARTFCMTKSHVGHDAEIGEDCELAPGAVVGGECKIGNGVKLGMNCCIRPRRVIGDGARIGMGAVVIRNVPAGEVWVGNPARPIEKSLPIATGVVMTESEIEGWEQLASTPR